MKSIRNSKGLYWGLIITFFVLYALVGFVSTLHSITFFQLANTVWMAVLLGITYEVGQAAVLFSILMSDNNKKLLPWFLMILLTALQITANVYASFKFMDSSGSNDWTFWQRSILFWLEADGPEMFKVVISWISGALLPVVALGMTALVAENLKLKDEQDNSTSIIPKDPIKEDVSVDESLYDIQDKFVKEKNKEITEKIKDIEITEDEVKYVDPKDFEPAPISVIKDSPQVPVATSKDSSAVSRLVKSLVKDIKDTPMLKLGEKVEKAPVNNPRGWHLKKEFIDDNGDVYSFGKFQEGVKSELPKKA